MSDQNYNQNFFITPYFILNLPGLTLSYLKVYETIFQFWNKGKVCYLSNSTIHERTGVCLTQIKEALNFFEKAAELKRVTKGTKRYLIQPERSIEHHCSDIVQVAAPPAGGGRSSGQEVAAPPATEIKKLNKEVKCVGAEATNTQIPLQKTKKELAEQLALDAPEIKELFESKFSGKNVTLLELFSACQEHYDQKSLWTTRDKFLKWIKNEKIENYSKLSRKQNETGEEREKRWTEERRKNMGL